MLWNCQPSKWINLLQCLVHPLLEKSTIDTPVTLNLSCIELTLTHCSDLFRLCHSSFWFHISSLHFFKHRSFNFGQVVSCRVLYKTTRRSSYLTPCLFRKHWFITRNSNKLQRFKVKLQRSFERDNARFEVLIFQPFWSDCLKTVEIWKLCILGGSSKLVFSRCPRSSACRGVEPVFSRFPVRVRKVPIPFSEAWKACDFP